MSIRIAEDRSLYVRPDQTVKSSWIDIDVCVLGNRTPMSPEAVEKKFRKFLNIGDQGGSWPPPLGHWDNGRFVVCDGRHEYLANLMLGRTKIFVCWLDPL